MPCRLLRTFVPLAVSLLLVLHLVVPHVHHDDGEVCVAHHATCPGGEHGHEGDVCSVLFAADDHEKKIADLQALVPEPEAADSACAADGWFLTPAPAGILPLPAGAFAACCLRVRCPEGFPAAAPGRAPPCC